MHPRRLVRLNELILQTVSRAALDLKDPAIGFVTITGADLAPDISHAKIFYSVLGDGRQRELTETALERAKSHLRYEVGRLENLRKVPQLVFVYDDSVERASRVSALLNSIKEEGPYDDSAD